LRVGCSAMLTENRRDAWTTPAKSWRLTASGVEFETGIIRETPPTAERWQPPHPVTRSAALDLLRDRGGRLTHRVVSVLRVIAAEPGLSNAELAERLGVTTKSHPSRLLARLAHHGLIENTLDAALPFEANAWWLTASGRELERAIRHEGRAVAARKSRGARR
jgi:DNA-binding MarR family transcriptional regulator